MAARRRRTGRSAVVRVLSIGLPLVAVGLLAAVVLLSDKPLPQSSLTFSDEDLEAMRGGLQIEGPQFSGVSLGGDVYDFTARRVVPTDLRLSSATVEDLDGAIDYADGRRVLVTAASGRINMVAQEVEIDSAVTISTSDGYRATAARADVRIASGEVDATGGVRAVGPIGEIEADAMRMRPREGAETPKLGKESVIVFEGGVKLRYIPGASTKD